MPGHHEGFFHEDVRHLSLWQLLVDGKPIDLLTGTIVDYFSARIVGRAPGGKPVSIRRDRFVTDGFHEDVVVENDSDEPQRVRLEIRFDSDFADVVDAQKRGRGPRGGRPLRRQVACCAPLGAARRLPPGDENHVSPAGAADPQPHALRRSAARPRPLGDVHRRRPGRRGPHAAAAPRLQLVRPAGAEDADQPPGMDRRSARPRDRGRPTRRDLPPEPDPTSPRCASGRASGCSGRCRPGVCRGS
jgi:hypothetical protein